MSLSLALSLSLLLFRVLVPCLVLLIALFSFCVFVISYLVASSACRRMFVLSFEITELTPRTTRNTHFRVPHQRLKEEAARGEITTQSAHVPGSRPSVPCVCDSGCEPAVAASPSWTSCGARENARRACSSLYVTLTQPKGRSRMECLAADHPGQFCDQVQNRSL